MKTKPLIAKADLVSVIIISIGLFLIALGVVWIAFVFEFKVQVVIPLIAFGVAFLADLAVVIIYIIWYIDSQNVRKKGIEVKATITDLKNKNEDGGKYFEHPYVISYKYQYNGVEYYSENETIPEVYFLFLKEHELTEITIKAYKNLAMLRGKEY